MESPGILTKLKNNIKHLKEFHNSNKGNHQEKASELEKKEYLIISKIVNCFHEFLSDNFNLKKEELRENQEIDENDKYYWSFISKYFNTPVVCFCRIFERDESNKKAGMIYNKKEKIGFILVF